MNLKLKEKIRESLSAVLPITGIVLIISIFLIPMELGSVVTVSYTHLGFSSNINFQDDFFYLDGDTEFYDDGIMFCIYDKNGRLLYGTIPSQFPEETILKSNTPRMITGSNRKWMVYDSVYTYGDDDEMWVRGITSVHSCLLYTSNLSLISATAVDCS